MSNSCHALIHGPFQPDCTCAIAIEPALEIIRPDRREHIKFLAHGVLMIEQIPANEPMPCRDICVINRIPSLLRAARGEA